MKSRRMRNSIVLIVVILGTALVSTTGTRRVWAATFWTVSNLNDSGPGSLRQAVSDASPRDIIFFSLGGTIVLTTGEILINKDLEISGPGAKVLTISGNNASRVFNVSQGTVTIHDLTISNGLGGGIYNQGTLGVGVTILTGNQGVDGGGIINLGTMFVTDSTVTGNSASGNGGGIYNQSGTLTIDRSTISGNSASAIGGGIYNDGGLLIMTNSTISGNVAPSVGGIYNGQTANISNSTICNNRGGFDTGGVNASGPATDVADTIIALNTAPAAPDVNGDFSSGGYNLIGIADFSSGFTAPFDLMGTSSSPLDPRFVLDGNGKPLLRDNGGSTPTVALRYDSPAIDAGDPNSTLTVDQRDFSRPVDGDGDSIARIDIGAFEFIRGADLLVSLGVDKTSVRQGDLLTYTVAVHNFGRGDAQDIVVNDLLSSGTTFVNANANKGHITAPSPGQTGVVSWYIDDMPMGDQQAALIQVTVIVRGKTTITNTASATAGTFDPNMANNSASLTVSVASGGKR